MTEPNLNHESSTTSAPTLAQPAVMPITSQTPAGLPDGPLQRRPRDVRLLHLVLASLGITAYQERVPLQLLDFAYRYTSGVLQDALHLNAESYTQAASTTTATASGGGAAGSKGPGAADSASVSLAAVRLSIASRLNYQFTADLPKEFLLELAAERNRVALPAVGREWGVRLPPERYCLTGVGWGLKEEWESEADDDVVVDAAGPDPAQAMEEDVDGADGEDGDTRMEDLFGEDMEEGQGEDKNMMDG